MVHKHFCMSELLDNSMYQIHIHVYIYIHIQPDWGNAVRAETARVGYVGIKIAKLVLF